MTTTPDLTTVADTYLAAYNERDADRRAQLIAAAFSEDGRLVDPPVDGQGHDGIDAVARAMQEQFAGHRFRRVSAVDAHHDRLRFAWELLGPTDDVVLTGMDVGELAADGRLARITGFFGDLPAEGPR